MTMLKAVIVIHLTEVERIMIDKREMIVMKTMISELQSVTLVSAGCIQANMMNFARKIEELNL